MNIFESKKIIKSAKLNSNFDGLADGTLLEDDAITARHFAEPVWTNITFQNSWVNYSTDWVTAQYMKDDMGFVHLKGMIKNGNSTSAVITTLPVGFRPSIRQLFSVISFGSSSRIDVIPDGNVQAINITNVGWCCLDGISFYAEG